jgi:hypothetical protein
MAKIGYLIAVETANFWLFGSIFGCLVTTAAKPFLKLMMVISADRCLHLTGNELDKKTRLICQILLVQTRIFL